MTRRIGKMFDELASCGEKALIPFIVAGDPDLETTVRIVRELERAGSHLIELGIPFSDPVADGPTIQRAAMRALRHRYGMADYLAAVREIRGTSGIPIMLFSYFNPVFRYGLENLGRDAAAAGVDGILITDITPEESARYRECMDGNGIDCIFLAAPTSDDERVKRIAAFSRGFVYVVSRAGVTGQRQQLSDTVHATVERVRRHTPLPVAVGFGISKPEQVRAVWEIADGAVVGSAIVAEIEKLSAAAEVPRKAGDFCRWLVGKAP